MVSRIGDGRMSYRDGWEDGYFQWFLELAIFVPRADEPNVAADSYIPGVAVDTEELGEVVRLLEGGGGRTSRTRSGRSPSVPR